MGMGIYGSAEQAAIAAGQSWAGGAGMDASAERRIRLAEEAEEKALQREKAALALAQKLKDALAHVAPNHELATAAACNAEFKKLLGEKQ